MTHVSKHAFRATLSRRGLLGAGGALVISFASPALGAPGTDAAPPTTPAGSADHLPLTPDQLDSWIAVRYDGKVLAFFGKMDPGQGVDVAIGQIVAEELDVPYDRVHVIMGDTAYTVNQGGASGSTGIEKGGVPLRNAAAEARRVLMAWASQRLGVPLDRLVVADGVISDRADPSRRATYEALVEDRYFDVPMQWNHVYGNDLVVRGQATPKRPDQYKIVGTSIPRTDITEKVFAQYSYVTDIRVRGMLHARMIRPPVAGSVPEAVDEASVANIPGTRVVWRKGVLAVLAPKEWDAIRAAETLKVTWSQAAPPFPSQDQLYAHIRSTPPTATKVDLDKGRVDPAFAGAARFFEAEYEWPFQAHASLGPACAVADVKADGATVWTGSQKPHFTRTGVARITGLSTDAVRAIWRAGPGSYGRNDAGDAALDAAFLSKEVGAPVRVQYMRGDGTGWDPKGPASVHHGRAGIDAQGNIIAYSFDSKGFSRTEIDSNESNPRDSLAGQLLGMSPNPKPAFGSPGEAYDFPAKRLSWRVVPPLLASASPLRGAHLRDPVGPQLIFASESFIDELAAATNSDAVAFRLKYLNVPRGVAVIKAAAETAGWETRPSATRIASGATTRGRGIAYAQRSATLVAIVAEVEVDRGTGRVRPLRFVVAHDCGLIVNPEGLKRCIEGNVMHGLSRSLWEEVTFDGRNVTSVDWVTYPILDIADAPQAIDTVLINHPELPPAGAGEASTRAVAAAVANAIFDATGVRVRRAPFTPQRIKGALV